MWGVLVEVGIGTNAPKEQGLEIVTSELRA